jgi:hypothetical protein
VTTLPQVQQQQQQQQHTPIALANLETNLADVLALPDREAAAAIDLRSRAIDAVHKLSLRSFGERGIMAREVERRHLWRYMLDPTTGESFRNFTAWMETREEACRRAMFDAYTDLKLLEDVADQFKLIDVPKGNIKALTLLSSEARNNPDILDAARTLKRRTAFEEHIERVCPEQHVEPRRLMRFNPTRSERRDIEAWIEWAIEHGDAASATEAVARACEAALAEALAGEEVPA